MSIISCWCYYHQIWVIISESDPVLLQLFCSLCREFLRTNQTLLKSCSEVLVIHCMFAEWPERLNFTMIGAWVNPWATAAPESCCPSQLRCKLQATWCSMSLTDPRADIEGDVLREAFAFSSVWWKRYQSGREWNIMWVNASLEVSA